MNILDYFEELVILAKDNPEQFEIRRTEIIEEFLNSLPDNKQDIMRRRQWRLDQELSKHKNSTDRYNAMVVEFWKGFKEFHKALNQLNEPSSNNEIKSEATIIEFKHK